ncbi:hypothetical protein NDU88_004579 [Pleurodeles waltl]|uniref:Uncharacterized protein n=1 Tax=Pleurodeles waltl TaxID=8319 RepID=A0AAV7VHH0_PLEWA|nr:hypothetical protein NDU88_004579 [Pleurodeles waltl]
MSLALRHRGAPRFCFPGGRTFTGQGGGAPRSPATSHLLGALPLPSLLAAKPSAGPSPTRGQKRGRGYSRSAALATHRFSLGSAKRGVCLLWGRRSAGVFQGL